jgi:hypothetical protein
MRVGYLRAVFVGEILLAVLTAALDAEFPIFFAPSSTQLDRGVLGRAMVDLVEEIKGARARGRGEIMEFKTRSRDSAL